MVKTQTSSKKEFATFTPSLNAKMKRLSRDLKEKRAEKNRGGIRGVTGEGITLEIKHLSDC
jgi:hypothetical protein